MLRESCRTRLEPGKILCNSGFQANARLPTPRARSCDVSLEVFGIACALRSGITDAVHLRKSALQNPEHLRHACGAAAAAIDDRAMRCRVLRGSEQELDRIGDVH